MEIIRDILQWSVLISGIADSYKYRWITRKISKYKSSREQSRKMINISLIKNLILLLWSYYYLNDWAVTYSCIIALYTGCEAFHSIYWFYPYRMRGCKNFKRPTIFKYTLNSLLPNQFRKRL